MKPLDRIANMSVLTRAGVEKVFKFGKIYLFPFLNECTMISLNR